MSTEEALLQLKGTIAVVGNAVFSEMVGDVIDGYDNVIRFNVFMTDGYEHYVGSKTTLWCTHGHATLKKKFPTKDLFEHHMSLPAVTPYTLFETRKAPVMVKQLRHARFDVIRESGIKDITTGASLLFLMDTIGLCADAFGFDFLSSGHYWQNEWRHQTKHLRIIRREAELVRSLKNIVLNAF